MAWTNNNRELGKEMMPFGEMLLGAGDCLRMEMAIGRDGKHLRELSS